MALDETGHSELLEDFFHEVATHGCGVVLESKMLRWTRRRRVTPSFWSLLVRVCNEVLEETDQADHGYKLYVGEWAGTYSFIIWDGGDGRGSDGWWQSVDQLAVDKRKGTKLRREDKDVTEEQEEEA